MARRRGGDHRPMHSVTMGVVTIGRVIMSSAMMTTHPRISSRSRNCVIRFGK